MTSTIDGGPSDKSPPVFRWAGSKRKLIPKLVELLPQTFERYVEPFAGSAQLFFHLGPKRAVLSDVNSELINAYVQIRDKTHEVASYLESIPDRLPATYYQMREIRPIKLDPAQRAARFIYLNRLCFNGLYRTNALGHFNVPFGGERSGKLPTMESLQLVARALQSTDLRDADFEAVLGDSKVGDFIYLDPPYSISNRRVFNNYSHHVFDGVSIERLREHLKALDKRGCKFLISYGMSREGLQLGKGWISRRTSVQRQISGFATHRRIATELLITNY